jgi:hypothetical protein
MDITGIYLTLNRMPPRWVGFHRHHLELATAGMPIISVSREPINIGHNIIDEEPTGYVNIYRQILRASKLADTKYVAILEDDTLYHKSHFERDMPKDDEFAYNRCRWSVFSWGEPQYSLRNRISNCSCIAPRDLMIEALQERFDKYDGNPPERLMGECGRNGPEKALGITLRRRIDFYSRIPIVQLSHPNGTEDRQRQQWKSHAEIRAFDIPYWGKAENVVRHYG